MSSMTETAMTTSDKTRIQGRLRKVQDNLSTTVEGLGAIKASGETLKLLSSLASYLSTIETELEEVLEDEAWG